MKKILYIINVDWFFISHFLPVGVESLARGYEVHLACGITNKKKYLENLGFVVHVLALSRSGTRLRGEIRVIYDIYRVIVVVGPDILEFFTIKPVLYGGVISRFLPVQKKVFYITGLGYVFMANGLKGWFVKNVVKTLYKLALGAKESLVITENIYDKSLISSLGVLDEKNIKIIRGAGVDLVEYAYTQEDHRSLRVSMACRLLRDKGIFEYIAAVSILKERHPDVEFELYGDMDIHNPASLTQEDVQKIKDAGILNIYSFCNNIADVFAASNLVVLPSYREGLPKVLVEAAACGRAVVTTDVPGCRDAIEPNITGLLCNVKDALSLANSIEKLLVDKNLRTKMGKAGRNLAEKEFDICKIVEKHLAIYEKV